MEESDESRSSDMPPQQQQQRLQSSFGTSPSSSSSSSSSTSSVSKQSMNRFELPQLNTSQARVPIRQFSQNFSPDNNNKRAGIPPSHPPFPPPSPYSQSPGGSSRLTTNTSPGPSHSRSLSQPAFFSLDSLPPFSPSPYRDSQSNSVSDTISADVPMEDRDGSSNATPLSSSWGNPVRIGESLPPRKAHRRSISDIPFGFASSTMQSSPPLIPNRGQNIFDQSASTRNNLGMLKQNQLVKRESEFERDVERNPEGMGERKSEGEVIDDMLSAYLNLDNIDAMNSVGMDDKSCHDGHEDLDSRASGTKTNGADSSDNETESSANESGSSMPMGNISSSAEKKEGNKRSAGGDIAPTTRHCRSVSMDSFMGNLPNFGDELLKYPPSPGATGGQHSHSNSMDGNSTFSLDFGNGEFNGAELKKIMANEKLAEIAIADPKRAKRILANRQSAARSKERKMRYISELEHKVQTLQTEATTLSAQLTLLQRDSSGLSTQNHELKFRLQAMEQQAHLRDALNEALTAEVQRLKVVTAELGGEVHLSRCLDQQLSINPNMFHLHNKHSSQLNMYQQQQPQQQQQQQQPQQQQHQQQQHQQQQQQQRQINATDTMNKSNQ